MMAKIFFIIFLIAVLILFVIMASSVIAILFHICGEDPAHQNSVNVPRGTTMGTTRTTNLSRTGKK